MEVLQENVNSAKGEKIAEAIAKFSIQPNQTLFSNIPSGGAVKSTQEVNELDKQKPVVEQKSDIALSNNVENCENQDLAECRDQNETINVNRDEPPAQQAQSPVDFLCQFTTNFTVAYQIAKCLIEADEDVPFFNLYMGMMKSPVKNYPIEVTKVFRINGIYYHPIAALVSNHKLLMHGVHKNDLFNLLAYGFNPENGVGSAKSFFGRSFSFTNCSTKAFNFSSDFDSYAFERKADIGEIQPNAGQLGYILVCDVALGVTRTTQTPTKNEEQVRADDSLTSASRYMAADHLMIPFPFSNDRASYSLKLPYGGFRMDNDVCAKKALELPEFAVLSPHQIEMKWLLEVKRRG